MPQPSVLLVEYDSDERRQVGGWLEGDGYDVLTCPGPREPDYICLGGRGEPCPLAHDADVVVLDLRLASDVAMEGTAGWQLLLYYCESGKNVVAITGDDDALNPLPDEQVCVVERPVNRARLLAAVAESARRASKGGEPSGNSAAR